MATFNSYGDRQIPTPYNINTPEPFDNKFGTVDYVREGTPLHQIWYKSTHWGLLGKWVKYKRNYFYTKFFFQARAQVRPVDGFLHVIAQKTWKSRKDVPFGILNDVPLILGVKLPKNWNFGGMNRIFKPERQKFQTLITWNLLISWQNFYREYASRVYLRGWSHVSLQQIQDGGGRHL